VAFYPVDPPVSAEHLDDLLDPVLGRSGKDSEIESEVDIIPIHTKQAIDQLVANALFASAVRIRRRNEQQFRHGSEVIIGGTVDEEDGNIGDTPWSTSAGLGSGITKERTCPYERETNHDHEPCHDRSQSLSLGENGESDVIAVESGLESGSSVLRVILLTRPSTNW
jgi:hypothetical protein